jgi:hypothetical protein
VTGSDRTRRARAFTFGLLASVCLASTVAPAAKRQEDEPSREEAPRSRTTHRIPRASTPIEVDGRLDEAAWNGALVIELPYEVWPGDNTEAPVRTEALLLYDDDKLYAGFRAHDPEPERIRARLSDRDRAFQDDFVGIVVDTFNDERRAFEFFVNAFGVQMDLVQDDVNGNEDSSWDAIWDSAGHVNNEGFVTEMAIPYTSLRFQRGEGDQTWGLDVIRIYPRDQRRTLASARRDRDVSCYLCQVDKIVGFDGATPGKNLEITPTLVAGRTETIDTFPDGDLESDGEEELGVTVRWGFTPNLTLSGTANPDFSQVEADVARLNVNEAFALFFPEKRPFFLEGADFFDTPINAVYTRTVADPEWGTKVTGKEDKHAIGGFVARDDPDNALLLLPGAEGSTFTGLEGEQDDVVLRYRSDVGKSSAVGGLLTAREGSDGYHNRVAGVDTLLRPTDKDNLRVQFLGSQTQYPTSVVSDPDLVGTDFEQSAGELEDYALRLNYNHRTKDYGARLSYSDFGEDFRSDLGFVPRVDFRMAVVGGWYTWWQEPDSKWAWFEVGGDWDQTEDQSGKLLEREVEASFLASGPMQSFIFVGGGSRKKVFNDVEFDQTFVNSFFELNPTKDLFLSVSLNLSDREDFAFFDPLTMDGGARQGDEVRASTNIRYNFGRRLRTDLRHNYQTLDIDDGELFRANLTDLRIVYQFNVRMFARAIVQYLDVQRDLSLYPECNAPFSCNLEPEEENLFGQFLFSYKLNPQTALFAGYTENQFALTDTSLVTTNRTFFLKLGYAWVM